MAAKQIIRTGTSQFSSGMIFPYYREIDFDALKEILPNSDLYKQLSQMMAVNNPGIPDLEATLTIYEPTMTKDNYSINSPAMAHLRKEEFTAQLNANTFTTMKFDENANKILGQCDITTFLDPVKKFIWFYGHSQTQNPFITKYMFSYAKDGKIAEAKNEMRAVVFGHMLQLLRNPRVGSILTVSPEIALGLSYLNNSYNDAIKIWGDITALRKEYSRIFIDTVSEDELGLIKSCAPKMLEQLEQKRPAADKGVDSSGYDKDMIKLQGYNSYFGTKIVFEFLTAPELFKGMSQPEIDSFLDKVNKLVPDSDAVKNIGMSPKRFELVKDTLNKKNPKNKN